MCRYVAVGYETGEVDLMQMVSRDIDLSTKAHEGEITGFSFTKDSEKMCTCGLDRTLAVFAIQVSGVLAFICMHSMRACVPLHLS